MQSAAFCCPCPAPLRGAAPSCTGGSAGTQLRAHPRPKELKQRDVQRLLTLVQRRAFFCGAGIRFTLAVGKRQHAPPSGPADGPRAAVDDGSGPVRGSGSGADDERPEQDEFHRFRTERVSEALGYRFFRELESNPYVNRDAVVAGIQKALDGDKPPMNEEDFSKAIFQMEQKAFVEDCVREGLDPRTEVMRGYKQRMAQAVQDRMPDEAIDLLDNMAASWGVQPDVDLYNCLLLWLLDAGELWRAMLVFRRMVRTLRPNKETYDILLGAMGMNYQELPASFTEVVMRARATGIPPRVRVYWLPPSAPESTSLEVLFSLEHVMGPQADSSDLLARFGGPVPANFRESVPEICAGRVTELQSPTGARVLLFGHDHTPESKEAMAALIRSQRPDTVMVEMCRERVALLESRDDFPLIAWLFPDQSALPVRAIRSAIDLGRRLGADMRGMLEALTPGIEFREAAALAEEVGAEIFLGDRPWTLTLERAMAGCGQEDRRAFLSHLFGSISQFDDVTRRDVAAEHSAARAGKGGAAADPAAGDRLPLGSPLSGGTALQSVASAVRRALLALGRRVFGEADAPVPQPKRRRRPLRPLGAASLQSAAAAAAAMAGLDARRRMEERDEESGGGGVPMLPQTPPFSLIRSSFGEQASEQQPPQPQQQQLVTLIQSSPLTPACAPILPPDPFSSLPEVAAAEAAAAEAAAHEAAASVAAAIAAAAASNEAAAAAAASGGAAAAAGLTLTVGEAAAAGAISGHPEVSEEEFDAWVRVRRAPSTAAPLRPGQASEGGGRAGPAEGGDSLLRRVDPSLGEQWPEAYRALIGERDGYMADVIRSLTGPTVVAVVGSAHVAGIAARWNEPLVSRFIMQHIESAMGRMAGGGGPPQGSPVVDPSTDFQL